jgi:hypothetical protein
MWVVWQQDFQNPVKKPLGNVRHQMLPNPKEVLIRRDEW